MLFSQVNGGAHITAYLDPGGTYQSEIVMILKNDMKALSFSFGMGLQFPARDGHWIGAFFPTPAYRVFAVVEETQISQQVGPIFPDGKLAQSATGRECANKKYLVHRGTTVPVWGGTYSRLSFLYYRPSLTILEATAVSDQAGHQNVVGDGIPRNRAYQPVLQRAGHPSGCW